MRKVKVEICFSGEVNCTEGKVKSITLFITEKEYKIFRNSIVLGDKSITLENIIVFLDKVAYIKCAEVEDE